MAVTATSSGSSALSYEWLVTIAGLVAGIVAACFFCQRPHSNTLSWGTLVLISVGYVSGTALAGGVGAWTLIPLPEAKDPLEFGVLAASAGVGWVWIPAII